MLMIATGSSAQSNKDKAYDKGMEAIKIMDEGKIDESIVLLKEAEKLDPDRFDYPYEIAYAHYQKKDYKGAIKLLEKLADHKDVTPRLYQLLGNAYDVNGDSEKAFAAYDKGLKKFPHSGILFLEKGNVYWGKEQYEKALPFYEKGIEEEPTFPSNYYRITRIYCHSDQAAWGMVYGEIFMNLERSGKRNEEISKLLYDTYRSKIKIKSETSMEVNFCKNILEVKDPDPNKLAMPFCMVYEPTLLLACLSVKDLSINTLDSIRSGFVETYYKMGHDKTHPNVLFDFQNKISKAGHMQAYNYWILMNGDTEGFDKWQTANKDKWNDFVRWFKEHKIEINGSNKFYRGQY
jgi:tetratricopeptide (TPR) repeat protein